MSDEALSPSPLFDQQRRRRFLLIAVIGLIGLGAAFAAKPSYRWAKAWRARGLAVQAESFLKEGKSKEASEKALAAYQLSPGEPAAIRMIARLESAAQRPMAAVAFWKQLCASEAGSLADRQHLAKDLLRAGAMSEAEPEVNRLMAAAPADATNLHVAAMLAAAQQRPERALQYAERGVALAPGDAELKFFLAMLRVESPRREVREEGRRTLLNLSGNRDAAGLQALTALTGVRDLSEEEANAVMAGLREHPAATDSHKLAAFEMELRLQPGRRVAVLDAVVAAYGQAPGPARRLAGVWLNGQREFERTLTIIPLTEAMQRKDLLLVHLDAMAALGRWAEIREILQTPRVPLDGVYTELFLARSAAELGEPGEAELHWKRAHVVAAPSSEHMLYLAGYAEKVGATATAEAAYRSLASSATTAQAGYGGMLRMAEKRRDTTALHDLLRDMHARWPADRAIENDYAYLRLLLGQELDACLASAQRLAADAPSSLPHRTTLALAHFRLGNPAAALAAYDGLEIPWERISASQRAVHAAVLGANGKVEEARKEARILRLDSLRPEEIALLRPWREP